jgi:hypothetical protein
MYFIVLGLLGQSFPWSTETERPGHPYKINLQPKDNHTPGFSQKEKTLNSGSKNQEKKTKSGEHNAVSTPKKNLQTYSNLYNLNRRLNLDTHTLEHPTPLMLVSGFFPA